jgi:hypothetical protein
MRFFYLTRFILGFLFIQLSFQIKAQSIDNQGIIDSLQKKRYFYQRQIRNYQDSLFQLKWVKNKIKKRQALPNNRLYLNCMPLFAEALVGSLVRDAKRPFQMGLIQLSYERYLHPRHSLEVMLSLKPSNPSLTFYPTWYAQNPYDEIMLMRFAESSTIGLVYRYHLKNGFYFGGGGLYRLSAFENKSISWGYYKTSFQPEFRAVADVTRKDFSLRLLWGYQERITFLGDVPIVLDVYLGFDIQKRAIDVFYHSLEPGKNNYTPAKYNFSEKISDWQWIVPQIGLKIGFGW